MKAFKCGGGKLYSIPMSDLEYIGYFGGKSRSETVKSAYPRISAEMGRAPDFLFNAELFDFATREPASDVVAAGTVHRLTEGYGIAFPQNKEAVFCYKNIVGAGDYLGAYPLLIRNGKSEKGVPTGIGGARGRTAIGVGKGSFYIALIPDGNKGVTLSQLRSAFKNAGAIDAINLDGGGSTQFYAVDEAHLSGRPVRGFIGIWIKGEYRRVSVRSSLNVRSGPGIIYRRVGKLVNGDLVRILEKKPGWCRISTGWVSSLYLK